MDIIETRKANVDFHRALLERYGEQPFFRPENRRRVRSILSQLATETGADRLLDIGCGTGFILDLANESFRQLDGIDITPEMLAQVTPRPNVHVQVASAEALPFEQNGFSVVTMYSVLHHVSDLSIVFREIRRVLRPGGVFYADESPSHDYRAALLKLADKCLTDTLTAEVKKTTSDAELFFTRYGIDPQITRKAMVQNYEAMGLSEDNLRALLMDAGFQDVSIDFRRFCGEEALEKQAAEVVKSYLKDMLPLTRHLFKYFVLIAR